MPGSPTVSLPPGSVHGLKTKSASVRRKRLNQACPRDDHFAAFSAFAILDFLRAAVFLCM